ncbi:MAG: ATP-binding protein [Hydrogenothermaceae bacterium]|nr:ATP-binding protein [Hydrogenothermaceae bacterium]
MVIEEAQNFAPERAYAGSTSAGKDNLSLATLQRIATEGRKFDIGLLIITQRPAQVSKYVLSQMNTQVVFRTISKQNLDALENFMEHTGRGIVELAPPLPTGVGIINGVAVPFSIVFEGNSCE